jgi:hypothetical protein
MRMACGSLALALAVAGSLSFVGVGCKGKSEGGPAPEQVTSQIAQLQQEESDLLSRRDELSRERKQVAAQRAALVVKRKEVAAAGGDVGAVEAEERDLVQREQVLGEKEKQLDQKYETVIAGYQQVATVTSAGQDVTRREASVALREKDFSRREDGVARREAELAARERDLAKREKETCSTQQVTTIVQPSAAASRYDKKDVESVLKRVRRKMGDKGLLSADLPTAAQNLEKESTQAMADADYGRAKLAADQLYATVEATRIDKAFIAAKIGRLNGAMKANPVADDKRKDLDGLFKGATTDYGDGNFTSANGKLNRINAMIR